MQLIENNNMLIQKNAYNIHKKALNKVHMQLIENNNMLLEKSADNIHKKAFNKVLMQIKSKDKVPIENSAGYKDSSANDKVNKQTIVPTFNKIRKIKITLTKYIENTRDPLPLISFISML